MPEAPEVRIMSEFLNEEFRHRDVIKIEKNPNSKNKCDLSILDNRSWKVSSESRGKEMMLTFTSGKDEHKMKVGFARIGNVAVYNLDETESEDFTKRAMLRFYTKDKIYAISDFTRYVIWRWADEWDKNRSPDILTEHNDWRAHLYHHRTIPYFNKPIFELMNDQRFFNGVGTFARTEILARTGFSPFLYFSEILSNEKLREDFFKACKETMYDIVRLGGLQFQHWKNPSGVSKKNINIWIRVYNKMDKGLYIVDSKGRKLWFERKWIPAYVKYINDHEVQDTRLLKKIYKKIEKTKT